MKAANFIGTDHPIPLEVKAFQLSTDNKLNGPSSLYFGGWSLDVFWKEFRMMIFLNIDQFCTSSHSILNEFYPREDEGVYGPCTHMTSSCKIDL